jgi:large subunit ribosomal protein L28
MARKCDLCGKATVSGNNRSHANNKLRRVWKPNLHKVHALVGATHTTLRVCTSCLRSGKVVKA